MISGGRSPLIQRGSCGYGASDRRRRSPEPKSWSAPPSVIARGRNLQDAGHGANGIQGLVRAHEPVNPFGLALLSRANQAAAFAGCRAPDAGDGSHVEGAPVPPARRLSAHQCACRHPARLVLPKWKSTVRSARTRAPAPRASVQIAPDRPSVAGTPADKRFGNGVSDTSKINFKGVHQTGSPPDECYWR